MLATIDLTAGITYSEYISLVDRLVLDGKTTGTNQSTAYVEYTRINQHRQKRLDKTTILQSDLVNVLKKVNRKWIWVVITETWCGDAAQNVPVIAKMASINENISLKLYLRDENPELMDAYLTNGSRSIPKLICFDQEGLSELGTWGPRPQPVQEMVRAHKINPTVPYQEFVKEVQLWYARDKTKTIQDEFRQCIEKWLVKSE